MAEEKQMPVNEAPEKKKVVKRKVVKKKRKKPFYKRRFFKVMMVYAMIFLIIIAGAMGGLWFYLSQYEQSQSTYAIKEYINDFYSTKVTDEFLSSLDHTFESEESATKNLKKAIQKMEYSKDLANTDESSATFTLTYKDNPVGTVTFTPGKNLIFGMKAWKVKEDSIDLNVFINTSDINIPDSWTAYVGDQQIGDEYIVNWTQPFSSLSAFYGDSNPYGLPYLKSYQIGNKIGNLNVTVYDSNGTSYDYKDLDESMFVAKADETNQALVENYIYTFLPLYIQCLSNSNQNASGNYSAISPYLLSGGNLQQRLANAIEGQTWANSNGDTLLNITFNNCLNIGNGYFVSDFTYDVETIGTQGAVQATYNARVLLQQQDDTFYAVDIESY